MITRINFHRNLATLTLWALLAGLIALIPASPALAVAPTITSAAPSSGKNAGGTSVVLTGTNLTGTTSVTFGGVAATSITNTSATSITVVTPAGTPGAVDIVVTAAAGTFTYASGYTYTAPTITSASVTVGTTSGNTSVTLTGTGMTGTTSVTFGGTAATLGTITSTSVIVTTPNHAAGTVDVVLTSPTGVVTKAGFFTYQGAGTIGSFSPTSGTTDGGYTITVTGTNLLGTSAMTIAGTAATNVVAVSSTSVTATVPVHLIGSGQIVLTTPYGTVTSADSFSYSSAGPLPTPLAPTLVPTLASNNGYNITATGVLGTNGKTLRFDLIESTVSGDVRVGSNNASTTAAYTFTNLKPNTTYKVALTVQGDGYNFSDSATVTSLPLTTGAQNLGALAAPVAVAGSAITISGFQASYTSAIAGASGYVYYLYDANDAPIRSVYAAATTTFAGLLPGTTYKYRMKALGDGTYYTDSPLSNAITVVTTSPTTVAAPATATLKSATSDSLVFNTGIFPTGVISSKLKLYSDAGLTNVVQTQVFSGTSGTPVAFSGLTPNTTYYLTQIYYTDGSSYIPAVTAESTAFAATTTSASVLWPAPTIVSSSRVTGTTASISVTDNASTMSPVPQSSGTPAFVYYLYSSNDVFLMKYYYSSALGFNISGLDPTQSYKIKVSEVSPGYPESALSAASTIPTIAQTTAALVAPTASVAMTSTTAAVTVVSQTGTSGYIYYLLASDGTTVLATNYINATSFTFSGLNPATTYKVAVVAVSYPASPQNTNYTTSVMSTPILAQTTPVQVAGTQLPIPTLSAVAAPGSSNSSSISLTYATNLTALYPGASGSVTVRIYDATGTNLVMSVPNYVNNSLITGLLPKTRYIVRAVNVGDGITYLTSNESLSNVVTTQGPETLATLVPKIGVVQANVAAVGYTQPPQTISVMAKLYDSTGTKLIQVLPSFTGNLNYLTPGTTYNVTLTAIGNGSTVLSSPESQQVSFTTLAAVKAAAPIVNLAPGVTAYSAGISFSSTTNTCVATLYDATGTVLYRLGGLTGPATFTGLTPNTTYKSSAICLGNGNTLLDSDTSNVITFTTLPLIQAPTPSIRYVQPLPNAASGSTTSVGMEVYYGVPAGVTSLRLKVYDSSSNLIQTLAVTYSAGTPTTISGLNPLTQYTVTMAALGLGTYTLDSPESDPYTFTTPDAQTPPSAVVGINTLTSTGATISWTALASNAFLIRLYKADGTLLQTYTNVLQASQALTLSNLLPNTTYQVSVTSLGTIGSNSSPVEGQKLTFTTLTKSQLVAPTLVVNSLTPTQAIFSPSVWTVSSGTGRLYAADGTLMGIYPGWTSSTIVKGLSPLTSYSFTVTAIGNGVTTTDSPESVKLFFTTPGPSALAAPTISSATSPSPTTALVTVSTTTTAVSTLVRIYDSSFTKLLATIPNFASPGTITYPLMPGTTYVLTAQAIGDGIATLNSDESLPISVTTLAPVTLPRPTLQSPVTGTASVAVQIVAPSFPTQTVTTYLYKLYAADGATLLLTQTTTSVQGSFSGLQPSTSYQVSVTQLGDGVNFFNSAESIRVPFVTAPLQPITTGSGYSLLGVSATALVANTSATVPQLARVYAANGTTLLATLPVLNGQLIGGLSPNTCYKVSVTGMVTGYSSTGTTLEGPKVTGCTLPLKTTSTPVPNTAWVRSYGGPQTENAYSTLVDANNNVYTAGTFQAQVTFGSGQNAVQLSSAGGIDAYVAKYSSTGQLLWVRQAGGTSSDSATTLAFDASGNIIVSGYFSAVATFGSDSSKQTLTSMGGSDSFVAKYQPDGTFVWVRQLGGNGTPENANGLGTDAAGNIFVSGLFVDNLVVGTGSSKTTLRTFGAADGYLAKFAANGNLVWVKQFGSTTAEVVNGLTVDKSGNVIVTGSAPVGAIFGSGSNAQVLQGSLSSDLFLAKYSNDGNLIWLQSAGGALTDSGYAVATDSDGNVFLAGSTGGGTFGSGAYAQNILSTGFTGNIQTLNGFVAKYSAQGNLVWVRLADRSTSGYLDAIATDAAGNVYAGGQFQNSATFSDGTNTQTIVTNGAQDGMIVKLTNDGNLIWARNIGGSSADNINGIYVSNSGSLAVSGLIGYDQPVTGGVAQIGIGSQVISVSSNGGQDAFVGLWQTGPDVTATTLATPVPNVSEIKSTGVIPVFSTQNGATSYTVKIYDSTGNNVLATYRNFISGQAVTGLTANTNYKLSVTAIGDGASTLTSAESNLLAFSTSLGGTTPNVFNIGADQATLAFAPVLGAVSYLVTVYDSTGSTKVLVSSSVTPAINTFTGLLPGTTYKATVRPYGDGQSNLTFSESSPVTFTTPSATTLVAPTPTQSSSTATSITFNIPGILIAPQMTVGNISYLVKVYAADGVTLLSQFVTASATTITGLSPATTYRVSVTAIANGYAYLSSPEGTKVLMSTSQITTAVAPAPVISQVTDGSVAVYYSPVPSLNPGAYVVRVNGFTYIGAPSGAILANGLVPGSNAQVSIQALGDGTNLFTSSQSAPVSVSLLSAAPANTQLAKPVVTVSSVSPTSFAFAPTLDPGATGFQSRIYDSTGTNLLFTNTVSTTLSASVTNLLPGTSYQLELVAIGNGAYLQNSLPSNRVVITTLPAAPLDVPRAVAVASRVSNGFTPSFSASPGALGYLLKLYKADGTTLLASVPNFATATPVAIQMGTGTSFKFSITAIGDGVTSLNSAESALVSVDLLPLRANGTATPTFSRITNASAMVNFSTIAVISSTATVGKLYAADGTTLLATYPSLSSGTVINYPLQANTTYYLSLTFLGDGITALSGPEGPKARFTTTGAQQLLPPIPQATTSTSITWNTTAFGFNNQSTVGVAAIRAQIYSADGSQLLFAVPGITTSGSSTMTGLAPNTTYRLVMTALGDGVSWLDSAPSAPYIFTTPPVRTLTAPSPSLNFSSATSFRLSFSPVTGALTYLAKIYAADGVTLVRSLPVISGFTVTGLQTGTNYFISLIANGDGFTGTASPESAKVPFTLASLGTASPLTSPTPIVSWTSTNAIKVNYVAQTSATSVTVKIYSASGVLLQTINNYSTMTPIVNLSPATTYKVSVTSIGDGTYFTTGAESSLVSFTTQSLPVPAIAPILADPVATPTPTSNSAAVTFASALGAISYTAKVYASDGVSVVATIRNFVSGNSITGLTPSSNYFVSVTAIGDGVYYLTSAEGVRAPFATNAAGNLPAPAPTQSAQNSTSVTVTFPSVTGAIAYSASVYSANGSALVANYPTFTSGSAIAGLNPNTSYSITVTALGDGINNSNSPPSSSLAVKTGLPAPAISMGAVRPGSLAVQFSVILGAASYTLTVYDSTGTTAVTTVNNYTAGTAVTGLTSSTTYVVRLTAVGDGTTTFSSTESPGLTIVTPAPITLSTPVPYLSAVSNTTATVTFPTVADALSYSAVVYASDGTTVVRNLPNFTSGQTITGLTAASTYKISVTAIGNGTTILSSLESAQVSVLTANQSNLIAPQTNLNNITPASATVTFIAAPGSTSTTARLYASDGSTLLRTILNFTSGTDISGLASGTSYNLTLTAIGDGVTYLTSSEGSQVSFSTAPVVTLGVPQTALSHVGTRSFQLDFTPNANATAYVLKLYAADGSTLLRTVSPYVSGAQISSLTPGTNYVLKLQAIGNGSTYLTSALGTGISAATSALVQLQAPVPSVSQVTAKTATIVFAANSGATDTLARIYTGDGQTLIAVISGATSGLQFSGLTPDTDYMVTLQSIGNDLTTATSAESAQVLAHTSQPISLSAPTAVVSSITSSGFRVAFTAVPNALNYLVNIYSADGQSLISSRNNLIPSGTDITGLSSSTTYKITLVAVGDEAIILSSRESAQTSVTTSLGTVILSAPIPTISSVGSTSAAITFGAVTGASSYTLKVYQSGISSAISTYPNFASGGVINGLSLNTTYSVTVTSIGGSAGYVTGAESAPTQFTTAPPTTLTAPVVVAGSSSSNGVSVTINPVDNATDYKLNVYAANGTTLIQTVASYASGSVVSGLAPQQNYVLKAIALGDAVQYLDSSESLGVAMSTGAVAALSAPQPTVFNLTQRTATIVFNPVQGAIDYTGYLYAADGTTLQSTLSSFASGSALNGLSPATSYQLKIVALGDGTTYLSSAPSAALVITTPAVQALTAPHVVISGQSQTTLQIAFSPVAGATSYTAFLYDTDGTTQLSSTSNFVSGTVLNGLQVNHGYQVALQAIGDGINFTTSALSSKTVTATTAIPALLVPDTQAAATGTTTAIATYSNQANAVRFELQLLAADGVTVLRTVSNYVSGATISGLTPQTTYNVSIRAIGDGTVNVNSDFSTPYSFVTGTPSVLAAPTVTAGSITKTSVSVSFASVANASGYAANLYSSTGSLLRTIQSFTSGTAITSLSPNTSYAVSVTAIGDAANYTNSGESNRASFTTVAIPVLAPAALTLGSTTPHSAVVSFSNVTGSSSYVVTLYAADGVTVLRTIVNATSPLTISSLNANSRYQVSIFSIGDYTNYLSSAESAKLTIDTPPLPQVGAASPWVAAVTGTAAVLSFAAVPNAVGYTLKVRSANGSSLLQTVNNYLSGTPITGLSGSTTYQMEVIALGDGLLYGDATANTPITVTTAVVAAALGTPTGVAVASTTQTSTTVTFTAVAHATSYTLRVYQSGVVMQTLTNFTSGSSVTGLSASTSYQVGVTAIGDVINYSDSSESTQATFTTSAWPQLAAPALTVSSSQPTSASVSWSAVAGAASYTVKVYASNGSTLLQTIASAVSPLTVSSLTASTGYKVSILAVADGTHTSSAESAQSSVTTANRIQLIAQVPAATTITASSVTVTVPTVSGATGYSLQILNAGNNAVVQSSSSFVSGTTLTGLTASTNYVISVLALGDGITYSDSVAATATFSTSAWPQLAAPALAVSSSQPTSASVSWSAVAGAASYTVKVYASNGSTLLQTIASAVSPLTVSSLTASTGYKVSILAVADGTHTSSAESAQSSVTTASATTAPIVPPVTVPTTPSVDPAPAPAINTSVSLATADVTVVGQQAKVSLSAYINGASTPKATLISGDNVVQGLTLVDGNLVLTLAPKFSGKATVVVLADTPSQKVTVNIPVLVAPVPASKLEAAQSGSGIPTFNWLPSLNAQLYILAAGEVTLCKTEATACALKAPLANGTKLTLTALGADQTTSEPVELSYQGPAKLAAGTVSLGAPSKRLLSGEKTLLASAISSATQLKYGKVIVTAPAAVAGQALLKVRAVKAFLRQASAKSAVPVLVRFVSGQKDVSVLLAN